MSRASKSRGGTACVFCYKSTVAADFKKQTGDVSQVNKFLNILHRFVSSGKGGQEIGDFNWKECVGSCENCVVIMDKFCEEYRELKCLELKLEEKVGRLVNIMKLAGKVPSRVEGLREIVKSRQRKGKKLEDKCSAALTSIKDFREKLIETCAGKISKSEPRVMLEGSGQSAKTVLDKQNNSHGLSKKVSIVAEAEDTDEHSWREVKQEANYDEIDDSEDDIDMSAILKHELPHLEEIDADLVEQELRKLTGDVEPENSEETPGSSGRHLRQCRKRRLENLDEDDDQVSGDDIAEEYVPSGDDFDDNGDSPSDLESSKNNDSNSKTNDSRKKKKGPGRKKASIPGEVFPCQQCDRSFAAQHKLNRHVREVHTSASHKCSICGKCFKIKSCLDSHVSTIHALPDENFTCPTCGKLFTSERNLKYHQQYVHAEKNYQCAECGKAFKKTFLLNRHLLTHQDPSTWEFQCPECDRRFYSKTNLEDHILITHKREKTAICQICGSSFISAKRLYNHMQSVHEEKKHQCAECGKKFSNKAFLTRHSALHESPDSWKFSCDICGKRFYSNANLKLHVLTHSDTKKRFDCQFCDGLFFTKTELTIHVKTQHVSTGDVGNCNIYECDQCDKKFIVRNHLVQHIKQVHGEKIHECSECKKSFSTPYKLARHEKTHQDPSTWQHKCPHCDKRFYTRTGLDSHFLSSHKQETGQVSD